MGSKDPEILRTSQMDVPWRQCIAVLMWVLPFSPLSCRHGEDLIVTPFAQILASLRSVRQNYVKLTGVPAPRSVPYTLTYGSDIIWKGCVECAGSRNLSKRNRSHNLYSLVCNAWDRRVLWTFESRSRVSICGTVPSAKNYREINLDIRSVHILVPPTFSSLLEVLYSIYINWNLKSKDALTLMYSS